MKDDATWQEFKEMYFNKDMPVQLPSDEVNAVRASRNGQGVAYFKERFGKRLIPLEVGKYDDVENWKEEIVPPAGDVYRRTLGARHFEEGRQ